MEHKGLSEYGSKIFQSELIMNFIFDKLEMKDKINLSLCNNKINSFLMKELKFLKLI